MAFDRVESEQSVADRLNEELRDAAPLEILRRAHEMYGDKLALVSSFGAESAVLLHLAAQVDPGIAVLFLDTGMLFGQTLDYRKTLAANVKLKAREFNFSSPAFGISVDDFNRRAVERSDDIVLLVSARAQVVLRQRQPAINVDL